MMDQDPDFGGMMPGGEGLVGKAGAPLEKAQAVGSEEAVIDALRTVFDPEIPVNIYDLGLVYGIEIAADGALTITMTLTTPGCPVAGILPQQIADAAAMVVGVGPVEVYLVWDPPWSPEKMTEDARLALGMF